MIGIVELLAEEGTGEPLEWFHFTTPDGAYDLWFSITHAWRLSDRGKPVVLSLLDMHENLKHTSWSDLTLEQCRYSGTHSPPIVLLAQVAGYHIVIDGNKRAFWRYHQGELEIGAILLNHMQSAAVMLDHALVPAMNEGVAAGLVRSI